LLTVDRICRNQGGFPTCQEILLKKPDGGVRIITAPKRGWRIYAWIVNAIIGLYYETKISMHQHGHRKGRGVGTAWHDVLNRILTKKFIYEFDFMKFHDAIERNFLQECMEKDGVSQEWRTLIDRLNRCRKRDREGRTWLYQQNGVPQGLNTS